MIKSKIQIFFDSQEKKQLLSNFFSLGILQAANYILPLITLPYLVFTLGLEKYGLVTFAAAFISYFVILTDYGFNLTATKEIAVNRDNHNKIEEIFSAVMTLKLYLFVFSFAVLSVLIFSIDKFTKDSAIYYLSFGVVLGYVLFPVWFFQGMEKMKYITILNVIAKLIFTLAIFVFVHNEADYLLVPVLTSFGFIISGVIAQYIIKYKFNISFRLTKNKIVFQHLIDGWHVFLSKIAVSSYTTTTIFLLGILSSNIFVSYFSIAEKLITVMKQFISVIIQVLYPYINRQYHVSKEKTYRFLHKFTLYFGGFLIVLSMIVFLFSELLFQLIFRELHLESVLIFKIFLIVPCVMFISQVMGELTLLSQGYKKQFARSVLYPALIHLIILWPLIHIYDAVGAVIAVVFTETFIMIFRIYYVKKNNLYQGKCE